MNRLRILITALSAVALAGCATTGNVGGVQPLADGSGYYVPADNGNGDYYYNDPQVVNSYSPWQFSMDFGFGSGWYGPGFGPWGWYGPGYGYWGWYGPGPWWYGPPPGYWHHHHHAVLAVAVATTCCQRSSVEARPAPPVRVQWRAPPERRPMRMEARESRRDFPRSRPHEPR
ncbi:MAG: hypothetical protein JSR34_06165 [Proteobacteria bacterium]|nr:hypothetical protein [Pseudomonadota bacterium]